MKAVLCARFDKRSLFMSIALSALFFATVQTAYALDSADVLPQGVNSPAVRLGVVGGIGQKYDSSGHLVSLTDYHSIEFDTKALAQIEPRVNDLVAALNQFGRQDLGSALHLGTLRIDTRPDVRYVAPVHAYGVSQRWTLAVGVPVVTYKNKLSLQQTGSNISAIRSQVGDVSGDLTAAFDELNVSLVESARKQLADKGYKPLTDRSETFIGDVQLVSLYQVQKSRQVATLLKTQMSLPTGPGDDPDDLADLGIFGQTSVEQSALVELKPWKRLSMSAKGSLKYVLPDKVTKRVPKNADDTLPGPESKRDVNRQTGMSATVGVSGDVAVIDRISAGLGYEYTFKGQDHYAGDGPGDLSLLERETASNSQRVRAGVSYSSTEAYLAKEAMMPAIVSYEFSDTIRGLNVERQTIHELWVTLFF